MTRRSVWIVQSFEPWGCPKIERAFLDKMEAYRFALKLRFRYAEEAIDNALLFRRFVNDPHSGARRVVVQEFPVEPSDEDK